MPPNSAKTITPNHLKDQARGFTLLEMLVVLVIVSLTAAVVVPRMTTMGASLDFALKRESFEQDLNGMAYQALKSNQDMILMGDYTDTGHVEGSDPTRDRSTTLDDGMRTIISRTGTAREALPPINPVSMPLKIPQGWRVSVRNPVYFRSSGFCSGGEVVLEIGRAAFDYVLAPPLCHARLVE